MVNVTPRDNKLSNASKCTAKTKLHSFKARCRIATADKSPTSNQQNAVHSTASFGELLRSFSVPEHWYRGRCSGHQLNKHASTYRGKLYYFQGQCCAAAAFKFPLSNTMQSVAPRAVLPFASRTLMSTSLLETRKQARLNHETVFKSSAVQLQLTNLPQATQCSP